MDPERLFDEKMVVFFARAMGLSAEAAVEHLEFRDRALAAFDELRAALGDRCGELWFWGGRLNVGVSNSDYPPTGAEVDAAKLVLERHGLIDRSDLVQAAIGTSEMVAAMARVSAMLEGWLFAQVALKSHGSSQSNTVARNQRAKRLVIETVDGLTEEQQALVDAAVAVAGVPVEVAACLGPGWHFAPTPFRETEWLLLSVGDDALSLRVSHSWSSHPPDRLALFLNETETEVQITVAIPDLLRVPAGGPYGLQAIAGWRPVTVHLADPINGRRITGPGQKIVSQPIGRHDGFLYEPRRLPDGTIRGLVPNLVGLATTDALHVLHWHGFEPRIRGEGQQVTHQAPAASTLRDENDREIEITLGP